MIKVEMRGVKEAARNIEFLARQAGEHMVKGIVVVGESIRTDVSASRPGEGVPKDEGILAASGRVEGPDGQGAVRLTYGGAAAPYALRQHEEINWRHKLGEARYLIRGVERFQRAGGARRALKQVADAAVAAAASRRNRT